MATKGEGGEEIEHQNRGNARSGNSRSTLAARLHECVWIVINRHLYIIGYLSDISCNETKRPTVKQDTAVYVYIFFQTAMANGWNTKF